MKMKISRLDAGIRQLQDERDRLKRIVDIAELEQHGVDQACWPEVSLDELTPYYVEQHQGSYRYCAYHRYFHVSCAFSQNQVFNSAHRRYCRRFAPAAERANIEPNIAMLEGEVYRVAKWCCVRVRE